MRLAIDDLPFISASRLRAAGLIGPGGATAAVAFPASPAFVVALQHVHFPNRGSWSFFVCPCGRRCRTLRLNNNAPGCKGCLEAGGLRYRVGGLTRRKRVLSKARRGSSPSSPRQRMRV